MSPPPMTPLEKAMQDWVKVMVVAKPIFARPPHPTLDMTAQQARMLEVVADQMGLVSDCLAVIAKLRMQEIQDGLNDD